MKEADINSRYEDALDAISKAKLPQSGEMSAASLLKRLESAKRRYALNLRQYDRDGGVWALEQSGLQPTIDFISSSVPSAEKSEESEKTKKQSSLVRDGISGKKTWKQVIDEDPSLLTTAGVASFVREEYNKELSASTNKLSPEKLSPSQKTEKSFYESRLKDSLGLYTDNPTEKNKALVDHFTKKVNEYESPQSLLDSQPRKLIPSMDRFPKDAAGNPIKKYSWGTTLTPAWSGAQVAPRPEFTGIPVGADAPRVQQESPTVNINGNSMKIVGIKPSQGKFYIETPEGEVATNVAAKDIQAFLAQPVAHPLQPSIPAPVPEPPAAPAPVAAPELAPTVAAPQLTPSVEAPAPISIPMQPSPQIVASSAAAAAASRAMNMPRYSQSENDEVQKLRSEIHDMENPSIWNGYASLTDKNRAEIQNRLKKSKDRMNWLLLNPNERKGLEEPAPVD